MSLTDQQISFEMPHDPSLAQVQLKSLNEQFASTNVQQMGPEMRARLAPVMEPEKVGSRSIQVDPTLADNVERIGADVNMAQSPEMGSTLSGLFDAGCKVLERNIEPVQEMVQPVPQVVPDTSLQPQDVKYTNEMSAPSPSSMMG